MVEEEDTSNIDREKLRLHLNMRPPSPATYQPPQIRPASGVLIAIGVISVVLILLCLSLVLVYAFIAGDPG